MSEQNRKGNIYESVFKRFIDFGLSCLILVLLCPVLGLIAIVLRFASPGPAIFKQTRIGQYGVPFGIYKFRTMTVESPTFGLKPTSFEDERLTKVGKFLRHTSLDELPQLLNVLRGEMSLVGPRPEQPFLVAQYTPEERERLKVKPGMTGWWQINGRKQPMHEYVDEDMFYVSNCSFLLDMKILFKTVRAVYSRDGAI